MARNHTGANIERSEFYGALQRIVDTLFDDLESSASANLGVDLGACEAQGGAASLSVLADDLEGPTVRRLDVVIAAEAADLPEDLTRVVSLLPPGDYTRQRLCDQLNSAITGHAWGQVYGTVS